VSEIQRIVHPPCDSVIRVVHRREQAQSKPGLAAQTRASGKISGSVSRHQLIASSSSRSSTAKPAKKREPSLNSSCPWSRKLSD